MSEHAFQILLVVISLLGTGGMAWVGYVGKKEDRSRNQAIESVKTSTMESLENVKTTMTTSLERIEKYVNESLSRMERDNRDAMARMERDLQTVITNQESLKTADARTDKEVALLQGRVGVLEEWRKAQEVSQFKFRSDMSVQLGRIVEDAKKELAALVKDALATIQSKGRRRG